MRLPRRAPQRVAIPAAPFADLALLLLMAVSIAAMYSVARGVGLRFAPVVEAAPGEARSVSALIVAVAADGALRFEGAAVRPGELVAAVRKRLAEAPEARVLLVVDPSAPYQAAIDAAAPLLRDGVLDGRPLSIPNRRQVEALRANPAAAGRIP